MKILEYVEGEKCNLRCEVAACSNFADYYVTDEYEEGFICKKCNDEDEALKD